MNGFKKLTFTFLLAISFTQFTYAKDNQFDQLTYDQKLERAIGEQEKFYGEYQREFAKAHKDKKTETKSESHQDKNTLKERFDAVVKKQTAFYKKLVAFLSTKRSSSVSSSGCSVSSGPSQGYGEMKLSQIVVDQFTPEQMERIKKELGSCLVTPESSVGLLADTSVKNSGATHLSNSKAAR